MAFPTMTPFICLLFVLFETFVPSAVAAPSGTEFVFAPMPNHPNFIRHSTIGVILQATTDEPTTVRIEIPERSIARQIPLSPGSGPFLYSLARTLIHQTTSGPIDSTICVSSDKAISALHYNLDQSNSDMFTLMPLHTLGKEYFVATITWGSNPAEGSGVISISSLRESVSLEVHVTSTVRFVDETFNSGDVFRYTLRPFKSIQLLPQYTGITGTRILANTTISVSAGAKCANVPEGVEYCDHIAEQLAPFTAWGKMFLLSPFVRRASGYVFQVVAGRDQTTVLYNDVIERLNMGQFVTVNILSQTMTFVSSDKPISVMQYSKGRTSDRVTESDPSMIRVPPIEQFVSETIFPVYDFSTESTHINTVHLELTAECRYFDNIFVFKDNQPFSVTWIKNYSMEILDGTRVCSQWTLITGGTYTVRSQCINTTEGHAFYPRFRAVVYGTGSGESYLYRAGASDRPLTCSNSSLGAPAEEHDCPILTNPEIVSLMATSLNITWSTIPSATGLFDTCTVYINSEGGIITRPVAIATPPYAATLSGLQPYTEYSFYMNCSNSLGIRSRLDFPCQTTLKAEPHPPTNVTVTEVTQTSAVVSWEPPRVSNGDGAVDGYVVFAELRNCLSTSCSSFLKEHKTEGTSQSVDLDPFATYSVVVIAYNIESRIPSSGDVLNSSRAISDEFTTLKAEPGPPNDVVVNEVTESSALVSWTQPSVTHGPIDGYTVYAIHVSCSSVSCTSAKTDVSSSIMEHTLTLRPYISYRAVVVAFTSEPRMPDHAKQNSTLAYSNTFTTLQTVPVKPAPSSTLSGGLTHYSFDISIPAYQNPNGPVSCFEVIVVQLYDAATSIDSDDNAYSINNTRDFSLAKTRIGTPFRALAFSIIPDGNVITVGSKAEVHSQCNTGIETNEDDRRRKRRATTIRATTLHAINGPLNPDSYYSCFIRVYSPSHRKGEVYFANGPFIQPIQLKVPGMGTSVIAVIVSVVILIFIVVIILLVCICKRKRSRLEASRNSPFSAGVFYRHCTDALPQNPSTSPGTQQLGHEYDSFDKESSPVYENVEKELVEGEYQFMIYRSEGTDFFK